MVHVSGTEVTVAGLLVAFFAGENEGVKPQGLSVVGRGCFMRYRGQLILVFSGTFRGRSGWSEL